MTGCKGYGLRGSDARTEIERTKEADTPGEIPGRSGLQADRRTGSKFIMRGVWLRSKEKEEIIMNASFIGGIIAVVVILLIIAVIKTYNHMVVLRNRVDNQGAQIEVQLKRRADLIPNLLETTKGYAHYELSLIHI